MFQRNISIKKQRIGIFLPALWGGGAERTMLNLAHGFSRRGYDVDLLLARKAGPYLDDVSEDLRLIDLSSGKTLSKHYTLQSLPRLIRYLRKDTPDALLASLTQANLVAAIANQLAFFPGRVIVNEQNTLSKNSSNARKRLLRWAPVLVKKLYPWADGVVGVSEGVSSDLIQSIGLNREIVSIIHNPGITPELEVKAKASVQHPWFEKSNIPVVLAVGSLTEQKDFATLIDAFARARETREMKLLILGEGRLRTTLETQIKKIGLVDDVCLPGFAANPYAYMSQADVFVLSSQWEGLPTVLVEAMYCGASLVATDCPSGPREILDGGRLGRLVPVGDTIAIADGILRSLDKRAPVIAPADLKPYELETVIDQYLQLMFR